MKITEDEMRWIPANSPFPPLKGQKTQRELMKEHNKRVAREFITDAFVVVVLTLIFVTLIYAPNWWPIVRSL